MPSQDRSPKITVLAEKLNIFTFQGVVERQGNYFVPALDGQILQISPEGKVKSLAKISQEAGIPFGITVNQERLIVTVSALEGGGSLVSIDPTGKISPIADFAPLTQLLGGPFGVTTIDQGYGVALTTDATELRGSLVQVTEAGKITVLTEFLDYEMPFDLTRYQDGFVVAMSSGWLLQVDRENKIKPMMNLRSEGYGIALGVATICDRIVVTNNKGFLLQINLDQTIDYVADVEKAGYGTPSGIFWSNNAWIVTTTQGFLLRIAEQ